MPLWTTRETLPRCDPLFEGLGDDKGKNVPVYGIYETHAVGSPDADIPGPAEVDQFLLEALAVGTRLGEAARFNHNAFDPPVGAGGNGMGNLACRNEDDGHV